jgi:hypothetical protein
LKIPLDTKIKNIVDIPYTISFVIRKRLQIDSLSELGSDKQPPQMLLWDSSSEELDKWLKDVLSNKKQSKTELVIDSIEG